MAKTTEKATAKKVTAKAKSETKAAVEVKAKAKSQAAKPAKAAQAKKVAAPVSKEAVSRCGGKACKIENCKAEYKAKGYCKKHYKAWRHGAYGMARYKTCGDLSCFKPMSLNRHGFCEEHYQNYYVKGMEQAKATPAAPKEESKEKVA